MELIIEFYKSLDTLNLIIFWGIIIVIILLFIFSFILLNKNKKLKHLVETNSKQNEELPIINNEIDNKKEEKELVIPKINDETEYKNTHKEIEKESKFIAEEHVIEYNKELSNNHNKKEIKHQETLDIPTKPYQRNVLKEMSLSQTSPIGITRPTNKEDRKVEMAKELYESLSDTQKENEIIMKELTKIDIPSPRKTEIKNNISNISNEKNQKDQNKEHPRKENIEKKVTEEKVENHNNQKSQLSNDTRKYFQMDKKNTEEIKKEKITTINEDLIAQPVKELLNSIETPVVETKNKSTSEKYLEEVSKKLSEADLPDEIERTDYELEQEENAIISYKELMEKKDSIQTIDEEEAIISIEELMNRNNQNKETEPKDTKLYNLTEEEENDDFIKELKQFRQDL